MKINIDKWFINLISSLIIAIVILCLDKFTNFLSYDFSKYEILVIFLLSWILFNQCDILKQKIKGGEK